MLIHYLHAINYYINTARRDSEIIHIESQKAFFKLAHANKKDKW